MVDGDIEFSTQAMNPAPYLFLQHDRLNDLAFRED